MQTLVIDGRRFAIEFAGFSQPLRAAALDELEGDHGAAEDPDLLELPPWRCADHLAQLRACLQLGAESLELDAEAYADAVLARAVRAPSRPKALRAVALWWATGREPDARHEHEPRPDAEGWVVLDGRGTVAKLRPWTWGERLGSTRACLHDQPGALELDVVAYLEAMIASCVVELRGPGGQALAPNGWSSLDAQATRRLLAALSALNHPEVEGDPLAAISPALAASTLRLCAALGWTPERVLATPAAEVQRLLMLLDKIDRRESVRSGQGTQRRALARPQPQRRPSIADHPDAVVILFEDDGGDHGEGSRE